MKNLLIVIFLLASIAGFSQQQTINIGTSANDGTGDPLRTAFQKTNANFTELYVNVVGSGTASGTDTYTLTADPTAATYYDGQRFIVKFTNSNTGSATININSLGAKTLKKNVSSDLSAGDIQAGQIHIIQYDGTNFQVLSIVGGGVSLGTEGQIPVMNSTDDDFVYSDKFKWDDTNNNFIAGNGTIVSGTNNYNFGDNTSITGSWVFTSAESATIYGNNSISAGWTLEVGDGVNFGSGSGTSTFGVDHKNYGRNSHISGIGGQIDNNNDLMGGFVHAFNGPSMDGLKPTGIEYVLATDGAFNVSQNTVSQTAGHGAMAPLSVILGGRDHNIPSSSPRSAIIGGDSIKARGSDPDNVYVPYFNITQIAQDDTLTQIVARNGTTGKLFWRDASTLGGGGGGGTSLLPTTGTGTATGDVTGDLDGNTLTTLNSGGYLYNINDNPFVVLGDGGSSDNIIRFAINDGTDSASFRLYEEFGEKKIQMGTNLGTYGASLQMYSGIATIYATDGTYTNSLNFTSGDVSFSGSGGGVSAYTSYSAFLGLRHAVDLGGGQSVNFNINSDLTAVLSSSNGTDPVTKIEISPSEIQLGTGANGITFNAGGEIYWSSTRTTCAGAPSGSVAKVSGVLTVCP